MPAAPVSLLKPIWWPQVAPTSLPQIKSWCSGLCLPFVPPSCSDPGDWMTRYIPTPELISFRASVQHLSGLLGVPIYLQLWTRANDPGRTMFPTMAAHQVTWAAENLRPFQNLPTVSLILDLEMGNMGTMPPECWATGDCKHAQQIFIQRPSAYGWLSDLVPVTGAGLLRKRKPRPAFDALRRVLAKIPEGPSKALGFTQDTATPAGNNPIGFASTQWKPAGLTPVLITPYDWDGETDFAPPKDPNAALLAASLRRFRKAGFPSCIYDRRSILGRGSVAAAAVDLARK